MSLAVDDHPRVRDFERGAVEVEYHQQYHQQYLHKVPGGYCPDHSTGVSCPIGLDLG